MKFVRLYGISWFRGDVRVGGKDYYDYYGGVSLGFFMDWVICIGCLYFLYRMLLDIMFMYSYNLNEKSNQLDIYYMPDTFHKLVSLWLLVKKCKFSL